MMTVSTRVLARIFIHATSRSVHLPRGQKRNGTFSESIQLKRTLRPCFTIRARPEFNVYFGSTNHSDVSYTGEELRAT